MKHVKSVSAIALLKNGEYAGRIVCNWSDNPAGSVCTAYVSLDGYDTHDESTIGISSEIVIKRQWGQGKAGGYGYDKRSSAIANALMELYDDNDVCAIDILKVYGGSGNEREIFEGAGYTWIEVC